MKKLLIFIVPFIVAAGLTSCINGHDPAIVSMAFHERIPGIDKDYLNGAILQFDANGNIIVNEISRETRSYALSESGLLYKFVGDRHNKRPLIGDVLDMNLKYTTETDSVLFDSKDAGSDFRMRLEPPAHHGSIEEAFLMMAEGDSAIFKIDGADFYRYTRKLVYVPDFIKPGDKVVFYVRLKKITPKDEFGRQISASDRQYAAEELSMINRFLLTEDLQITPTASGLYFKSLKKQGNIRVKPGNTVSVRYTAMFLDGGVFDAVESNEPPFTFTMGKNEVIAGLEEAVGYMCVGETALAIIPFRLAYGSEKKGIIPPYSTLLFEITVTNAQ